jgi:hypothetical protein
MGTPTADIATMGVDGFWAWSGPYLKIFSKTRDQTDPKVGDDG